jgi:uncharacterized protein (TIGR02145 family)
MNVLARYGRSPLFAAALVMAAVCLSYGGGGSFTDKRDGKKYKTVNMSGNTWMAKNLNYQPVTGKSWCYADNGSYCEKYGKLYDWNTAMKVCPNGWRLPTLEEWGGLSKEAGKLKAKEPGWNGTDETGFSALPGGFRRANGKSESVGNGGCWWTGTENGSSDAFGWGINCGYMDAENEDTPKSGGFSVRCVQD